METVNHFKSRVEDCTGMAFESIPRREQGIETGPLPGPIFARRGGTFLVGIGYHDEDECYDQFELVTITLPGVTD